MKVSELIQLLDPYFVEQICIDDQIWARDNGDQPVSSIKPSWAKWILYRGAKLPAIARLELIAAVSKSIYQAADVLCVATPLSQEERDLLIPVVTSDAYATLHAIRKGSLLPQTDRARLMLSISAHPDVAAEVLWIKYLSSEERATLIAVVAQNADAALHALWSDYLTPEERAPLIAASNPVAT